MIVCSRLVTYSRTLKDMMVRSSIKNYYYIDSYNKHCGKKIEDCFVCTRLRSNTSNGIHTYKKHNYDTVDIIF